MTVPRPLLPVDIGREEARQRAAEELAKAKYGGTPDWLEAAIARWQRLQDLLARLLERWLSRDGAGDGVNWAFLVAVLALLGALVLVVWRVGLPRWQRSRRAAVVELEAGRPAADYRAAAEQHAVRGDWRAAVRDRFRALVRDLEVRTVLDERPARTAWEAAASAGRLLPSARPALDLGAGTFNAVRYGDRPADAATYAEMVAAERAVLVAADALDLAAADPAARP